MIRNQFQVAETASKKGEKPKPVKRPKGKDVPYSTNDVVSDRQGGSYLTR